MNYNNRVYGFDMFTLVMLLFSSILNLFSITRIFSLVILIYALYRSLSYNYSKRSSELAKFYFYINKFLKKFNKEIPVNYATFHFSDLMPIFNKLKSSITEKIKYKIVACPKCSQKLRLPRRKGNITVTCKRCGHEFKMRT